VAGWAPIGAADLRSPAYVQPPFTEAEIMRLQGEYFPARRWNYAPLLGRFLPALLPWTQVSANADGTLTIDGRGPWRQVAPRLFEAPNGRRIGFEIRGQIISGGSVTHSRLERHPWWAQPAFTVVPFFAALAVALTGIIPASSARRSRGARAVGWLAFGAGAVLLVCLAFEFEYGPDLYVADRDGVALAFRIPMQLALLGFGMVPIAFAASLRAKAGRGWLGRLHGASLTAAAVLCLILAAHFGLVGHLQGV
jgi:hypothetical protein